jgi:3-deoxy-7-phosphoheptulonate synthase
MKKYDKLDKIGRQEIMNFKHKIDILDIKESVIANILNSACFEIIAGPCTIESRESLDEIASAIKSIGINALRGGAFKMRTSPQSFRGMGEVALSYLKEIGEKYNLVTVTECIDAKDIEMMSELVDVFLIGTRSMYNYPLLEKLGSIRNPIILKRGMSSTYNEWHLAATYIVESGNPNVVLCERGIRTFETYTRNTLDLSSIPAMKRLSGYPIFVDPSHSTGRSEMVRSMSWAAVAAGANGLLIETHLNPSQSVCDAEQAISLKELETIYQPIKAIRKLIDL